MKYLIGIDEAGRGSWAGPVVAGAFCVRFDYDFSALPLLTDSKKLSPQKRESLFSLIEAEAGKGNAVFSYGESSAELIDRVGIREANRLAMRGALEEILRNTDFLHSTLSGELDYAILIDGRDNYRFEGIPSERITYIVRGDMSEPVISAASIVAKVVRDRKMCDFSKDCPQYLFSLHKGYGTKKHHDALLHYGIHSLHRKSYAPVKSLISEEA